MQQTQPTTRKMKKIKVSRVVNGVDTEVEIEVEDTGDGPRWGPNDGHAVLNKPLLRVDGPLKVTGVAKYSYDVRPPGMLFGRILRSPHARAKVKSIDLSGAKKIKGAYAVEHSMKVALHEGAPVAAVAAPTPEAAEDALRAIKVEWEVLDHVVTPEAAMKPGAPKVFPDDEKAKIENNVRSAESRGDKDQTLAALEKADVVVEAEYRTPMQHHVCLETHGNMVDYRGKDEATIYASTQGTHTIPGDAAKALGLGQSKVLSVVEHMGGGFGAKFGIGIEGQLACKLSKEAKAPVRMMLTRADEFLFAGNRSGSWQKLKGGASKDGTLVALHATQYRLGGIGNGNQAGQPYIYTVGTSYRDVSAIHTNEDASRAFRAPGHPQASYAIESLIDDLAHKLVMDPLEFRKKNLTDPVYHRQLDRGAKEIGWERRQKVAGQGKGPVKRGIGCAVGQWGSGGRPQCVVTVNIARDGTVEALSGSQDLGTGTRTYLRAIVAEELGLAPEDVKQRLGRSNLGAANASGGSTTSPSLAPAIKDAAFNARRKFSERVAPLLGVKPEAVRYEKGSVTGGGKSMPWKKVCAALPAAGISERGEWKENLAGSRVHGACFAEVEVDTETGHVKPIKMVHVQDVGLPLNRKAIESQINGGMIQSLGQALYEGRVMDAELGIMLNPDMENYKIPGSFEMPEMVPLIDDEDTRQAVIGVGEPALVPSVGALANAVFNAIGVRIYDLPITPDKILMALQSQSPATKEGSAS